ncbi:hypothetical protein ASG36_07140 [Geodermatophilus sp. Leaf369]|uniref:aldo/keto reductase n=1 Tax=Geodermatophilus sp. Leaf369 TaxID=1736354 RepID=UPI0006FC54D2|nr:aldo/keto reductase [Geodermatophilus sp. Leaf369]KQS60654.1 hypothetical protein ASG36_07140 [Geodermatophilus sp. Leaf369]
MSSVRPVFGTAQLDGLADDRRSGALLDAAWEAGFRAFDTAPSYGGGRAEARLGAFLAGRSESVLVSTKVGLAPALGSRAGGKKLVSIARRVLPTRVTRALKAKSQSSMRGRFDPDAVQSSVEASLRLLGGRIDRLLLHEVRAEEITDDLLARLAALLSRGDVGAVGVATQNDAAAAAVRRGGELVTVAHLAVGVLDAPVPLPSHVTTRVGHGLLGGGGSHLRAMEAVLVSDADARQEWHAAAAGTRYAGAGGLPAALVAAGLARDVTDVLVATTRVERVAVNLAAVGGDPLTPDLASAVRSLAARTTRGTTPD